MSLKLEAYSMPSVPEELEVKVVPLQELKSR